MNKLEARAIIENTGNYDEEEIEEVMDVYDALAKNMGWKDTRSDKRYVVKFHIFSTICQTSGKKNTKKKWTICLKHFVKTKYTA